MVVRYCGGVRVYVLGVDAASTSPPRERLRYPVPHTEPRSTTAAEVAHALHRRRWRWGGVHCETVQSKAARAGEPQGPRPPAQGWPCCLCLVTAWTCALSGADKTRDRHPRSRQIQGVWRELPGASPRFVRACKLDFCPFSDDRNSRCLGFLKVPQGFSTPKRCDGAFQNPRRPVEFPAISSIKAPQKGQKSR